MVEHDPSPHHAERLPGRAAPNETSPQSGGQIADPNRLNSLAVLYAELATGDPVRALMLRDGPIGGKIVATPVTVGDNHFMLPLVDLMAIAASPRRAMALAARGATALAHVCA